MGVTHILRAEEWINSMPKHILLYRAFGWEPPEHFHLPLLRNADKSKISKRKNPTSITWYRENGFLPEALVNFLALMGWSMGEDREEFTLDEFVEQWFFDVVVPEYQLSDGSARSAEGREGAPAGATVQVSVVVTNAGTGTMPVEFNVFPSSNTPSNRAAWEKCVQMLETFSGVYGLYPFIDEKYGMYEFSFGGGSPPGATGPPSNNSQGSASMPPGQTSTRPTMVV